jgi:hypothetical protein
MGQVEEGNLQEPEQKVEVVDVADPAALANGRPKGRGRPPGNGSRAQAARIEISDAEKPELVGAGVGGATFPAAPPASRINGRPTRGPRSEKPAPSRVNSDKPIFTLSVAAEILALHPRTLRIYEEHGLVVPHRTQTQRRRYSQNDIKKFQFIQFLTQRRRVNLEGVKIILSMLDELRQLGVAEPVKHIFKDYQEVD